MSCPILRKSFCVSPSAGAIRLERKSVVLHDEVSVINADIYLRTTTFAISVTIKQFVPVKLDISFSDIKNSENYSAERSRWIESSRWRDIRKNESSHDACSIYQNAFDVVRGWQIDYEPFPSIPVEQDNGRFVVTLPNYVRHTFTFGTKYSEGNLQQQSGE